MNFLISSSSNPYWNLATEEYLLKNSTEDFIFLYLNRPSVVVGKHQITTKEINSRFTFDNNILISRRLSGGGAVFHDEGNLNFSFIQSIPLGQNASYRSIMQPLYDFLISQGVDVELSDRNDFLIHKKKISGSAMHIYKNRVLAHCTLLVECNLDNLSCSLKGNQERFTDKSIASKRSKVTNLSEIDNSLNVDFIRNNFSDFIRSKNEKVKITSLSETDIKVISELVETKYSTFDWIYGYSPKYIYSNKIDFDHKIIAYKLEVEKNIIKSVQAESEDEINNNIILKLYTLIGKQHNINSLSKKLASSNQTDLDSKILDSLF
jgi:lipoate-protein ligase A